MHLRRLSDSARYGRGSRDRSEGVGAALQRGTAPLLDLVIVAGDRTSRFLDRGGSKPGIVPLDAGRQLRGQEAATPAAASGSQRVPGPPGPGAARD